MDASLNYANLQGVAPYVGAWIETVQYHKIVAMPESHPTWVRGLKPATPQITSQMNSRTLRGCVD